MQRGRRLSDYNVTFSYSTSIIVSEIIMRSWARASLAGIVNSRREVQGLGELQRAVLVWWLTRTGRRYLLACPVGSVVPCDGLYNL